MNQSNFRGALSALAILFALSPASLAATAGDPSLPDGQPLAKPCKGTCRGLTDCVGKSEWCFEKDKTYPNCMCRKQDGDPATDDDEPGGPQPVDPEEPGNPPADVDRGSCGCEGA